MKKMKILRKIKNNLIFISGFMAVIIGAGAVERCLPITLVAIVYLMFLVLVNEKEPCGGNHKTQPKTNNSVTIHRGKEKSNA